MTKLKTVLITGASSGFGLAACREFLKSDAWRVIAAVRGGKNRIHLLADLFAIYPGRIELLDLDLADPASITSLALALASRPPIDALVNNAGYGHFGATEDMTEEGLRRQMEVNFFGTFALTQKLLPALRATHGVILTVSSIVGRHAMPLSGAYCASKFAVEGWMESLSAELKPMHVACYLLEPGAYPTQFGNSLAWAVVPEGSAYARASRGYQALRLRISQKNAGKSLGPVGKKMLFLVDQRPLGLRHLMGSDALATAFLAKVLPANLWHAIMSRTLNRLQLRYLR